MMKNNTQILMRNKKVKVSTLNAVLTFVIYKVLAR